MKLEDAVKPPPSHTPQHTPPPPNPKIVAETQANFRHCSYRIVKGKLNKSRKCYTFTHLCIRGSTAVALVQKRDPSPH